MKRILLILALAMFSACATVPRDAPPFSRAADAPTGMANLYMYRTGAYPFLRGITVRIDGREITTFAEGSYTVVPVTAGPHEVRVSWPLDTLVPSLDFPIEIKDSASQYLKITSRPGSSYTPGGMTITVEAISVPQSSAEAEMRACCRLIPTRDAD